MRLGAVAGLMFCVLAGCQTAPTEPRATDEERSQATRSLLDCVREQTRQIDDKISDAYVIATAIVNGPCYRQADNSIETFSRGANPRVKEMMRNRFFNGTSDSFNTVLAIVLQERARTNQ